MKFVKQEKDIQKITECTVTNDTLKYLEIYVIGQNCNLFKINYQKI